MNSIITKIRLFIHKLRGTKEYEPDSKSDYYNEFYFEKLILNMNPNEFISI